MSPTRSIRRLANPSRGRLQGILQLIGRIGYPLAGLLALCWFLIRVIPKPSRAGYPCQRAAFPVASSFVIWLAASLGARWAVGILRREWLSNCHARRICGILAVAAAAALWIGSQPGQELRAADPDRFGHAPAGVGKGIYPGRVVWVHAPDSLTWPGKTTLEHWSDPAWSNEAVIGAMLEEAVCQLTGQNSVREAWEALFRQFNRSHGRGDTGYRPGEKIAIKLNLTLANPGTLGNVDEEYNKTYLDWQASLFNNSENSPQLVLAMVRHLVYQVGVAESDICLTDPTCLATNFMWDLIHPEFPDVVFADNRGTRGRQRVEFSDHRIYWSTPDADGKFPDYIPDVFAEATYLVNMAVLKSHGTGGITVCGKNHYGSLLRTPDGHLRDFGRTRDYYSLHRSLPGTSRDGMGQYRALVDLMAHPDLGGKTILCLVDGLIGGRGWSSVPEKWEMAPFNRDWPKSLLASMDPVAIDSVAFDFLKAEWPEDVEAPGMLGGAEDYLHEAALVMNPPSGTLYEPAGTGRPMDSLGVHEHWNNPIDKQYSRNLGFDSGIELVPVEITGPVLIQQPRLLIRPAAQGFSLYASGLSPGKVYSLEQIDPASGDTVQVDQLMPAAYGERRTLDAETPSAFFRLKEQ